MGQFYWVPGPRPSTEGEDFFEKKKRGEYFSPKENEGTVFFYYNILEIKISVFKMKANTHEARSKLCWIKQSLGVFK